MGVTPRSENQEPSTSAVPSRSRALLIVWLAIVASGAAATGLLRAGTVTAALVRIALLGHEVVGVAIGALAILHFMTRHTSRQALRAGLIAAVLASGWSASRTFAPSWAAVHAIVAAFAAAAILEHTPVRAAAAPWARVVARLAFAAMLIQIAAGGLLRHQLISLPWHLLLAGIASLLVLVAAVPIVQDPVSRPSAKRVAKSAITTLIVQVCLGAAIFVVILIGAENAATWLSLTVAHVVMGSITLVAALTLARAHRDHRATSDAA